MKLYQLTYLISPELSSEEAKDFSQEIDSLILRKGKLIKPGGLSRRALAYPIKKQTAAYLTRSEFHLEPQEIENFKKGGLNAVKEDIKSTSKLGRSMLKKKRMHFKLDRTKGKSEIKSLFKKAADKRGAKGQP